MIELFKNREGEVLRYLIAANAEIGKLGIGEKKDAAIVKLGEYFKKADEGYAAMSDAVSRLTDGEKAASLNRLKVYREKTEALKVEARVKLGVEGGSVDLGFERTLGLGLKSYEVGVKSLAQLKGQKDTILGYNSNQVFEENLNEADKALIELNLKKIRLKMSMAVIILLEFIILLQVLYIKLR